MATDKTTTDTEVQAVKDRLWKSRMIKRSFLLGLLVGILVLTWFCLGYLGFEFKTLTSERATSELGKFVGGLLPPSFEDLTQATQREEITGLDGVFYTITHPMSLVDSLASAEAGNGAIISSAAVTTLAAGLAGTVLGFPLALLFGVLGSERVTPFPFNFIFRGVMSTIRAIPAIVWTLIYIPVFGVDPATGVLAIGTDTIGNLGRLFTDELEEIEEGPIEAIRSTGAGRTQTVIFGMLSQVTNSFIAWTLYILEINTRIAISLGVLGVGGLGMYIDNKLGLLSTGYPNAMAGIFAVIFIVISIEFTSSRIRAYLRPSEHESSGLLDALKSLANPGKWLGYSGKQPSTDEDEDDDAEFDADVGSDGDGGGE